jgi:hypothetical protein
MRATRRNSMISACLAAVLAVAATPVVTATPRIAACGACLKSLRRRFARTSLAGVYLLLGMRTGAGAVAYAPTHV